MNPEGLFLFDFYFYSFLHLLGATTIILNIVFIIQIIKDVATTAFLVALYTMIVIEFQGSVGTIFVRNLVNYVFCMDIESK